MKTLSTITSFISGTMLSSAVLMGSAFAGQNEIDAIEAASMQMNSNNLMTIVEQEQGYLQALANYRLAIIQNISANKSQAITSLSQSITELEALVQAEPNNDEAFALLSQSYGMMTSYKPKQAKVLGEKASVAIDKALVLNPQNPRIMLFKGIMYFTTPEAYGGDKTKAIEALDQAITLYDNDRDSGKYWGEAEAHVWRGMSYQALNNNSQATNNFELALQISPNFGWAKMLLNNSNS